MKGLLYPNFAIFQCYSSSSLMYSLSQNCLPMENRHVPTCSSHNRVTKFSISPIPEARPQVLLQNRIGCYTAEVIIDIATISGKFTWNFVDMVLRNSGKANCCHPALMVLNSDWSSLGCLLSIIT
jgi:hypothetical protein